MLPRIMMRIHNRALGQPYGPYPHPRAHPHGAPVGSWFVRNARAGYHLINSPAIYHKRARSGCNQPPLYPRASPQPVMASSGSYLVSANDGCAKMRSW
eukprot:3409990-Prymnesium_polylepis.1